MAKIIPTIKQFSALLAPLLTLGFELEFWGDAKYCYLIGYNPFSGHRINLPIRTFHLNSIEEFNDELDFLVWHQYESIINPDQLPKSIHPSSKRYSILHHGAPLSNESQELITSLCRGFNPANLSNEEISLIENLTASYPTYKQIWRNAAGKRVLSDDVLRIKLFDGDQLGVVFFDDNVRNWRVRLQGDIIVLPYVIERGIHLFNRVEDVERFKLIFGTER